jgi:predicted TIM-barrel fold metal-dependent hydrolase
MQIVSGGKPGNPNHRQVASFTKDELLKEMDAAGVDAAVIHPPTSWDPNANELAVEAARQHPGRLAADFPPKVAQVAERHPGLKLIIDHLGRPSGTKDDAAWTSLPAMLALARHPNVAIKATGAPSYSSEPYPYRNIHGHLKRIYDAFGPARMFWGTDITRMPCSWRQCVTMFTEELPWLSGRDRELVMGGAVCARLGWTPVR